MIDSASVDIIADDVHLRSEPLQLIYQIKGSDKICLITDSMLGAGMDEGPSVLGVKYNGRGYVIRDGVAFLINEPQCALSRKGGG